MKKINLKKLNLLNIFKLNRFERPAIYLFTFIFFIAINLVVSAFSFRLDLSSGKAYTLSPATKKIINNLDDLINIKFYVSSDLPSRIIPLKTEVIDLLNEYQKEGRGKIILKSLDPKKDEKINAEVKELGIPELQFSELQKDKYAVSSAYFGMSIMFGNKKEVIPQVAGIDDLEYNLTSSIYKLTNKEIVKIGIIGIEPLPQGDPLALFKKIMGQQFQIEQIVIDDNNKSITSDIKTLLVFDSQIKFQDNHITAIKNYLSAGGHAIFFIDGVWVADNLTTNPADSNLFGLIESYGIKINKDFVLSTSSELVNFGNGSMQFLSPYPFWLKTNSFNNSTSYFGNVNQLTFPWASSLIVSKKNNVQTKELIKSTNKSWVIKENYDLNPQNIVNPKITDLKEFTLTAEATAKNSRIIVISSSRFALDQYYNRNSSNLEFVLNSLNELASGGALSGIRSRTVSFYPLPTLSDNLKDIFKYANILLLPIIFGIYGAVRLLRRK